MCHFTGLFKHPIGGNKMGKKNRNRINAPKKNNHTPPEAIEAEQIAHGKEFSAAGGRKNGPGHNE